MNSFHDSFCAFKKTYLGTNSLVWKKKMQGNYFIERCTFSLTKHLKHLSIQVCVLPSLSGSSETFITVNLAKSKGSMCLYYKRYNVISILAREAFSKILFTIVIVQF